MQQHTNAKLGNGSEVFPAKPRKIHAINANTYKRDEAKIILVTRMALLDAKLARSKEISISYKNLKEKQQISKKKLNLDQI